MYGPDLAIAPSWRRVSRSSTAMKCQGWRFEALPVRWAASTMRRAAAGGRGLSWNWRTRNSIGSDLLGEVRDYRRFLVRFNRFLASIFRRLSLVFSSFVS